jgi:CRISPR/Cas system-associated endonuclease Cas1
MGAGARARKLLPYEAQIMKRYWFCYGLALKRTQQVWFGYRKRSRYVTEFVGEPAGRARGYSPVDAAINYLHQRRLRQAERVNQEVGFPGTCDGFLHRERYNSRRIGLLLDMIDPFKLADREELMLVFFDQGLTWKDFRIETDRRGSNFYYPMADVLAKLDHAGTAADSLVIKYQDRDIQLGEAYKLFAENLLGVLDNRDSMANCFNAFVFEF